MTALAGPRPSGDRNNLLLLLLVWGVLVAIVDPRGDFPLNDDWSYATTVRVLLEEGRLDFPDWGAMTLLAHVLYGYLVTLVTGFSFTALRLATLCAGYAAGVFIYLIIRRLHGTPPAALLGALTLLLNPIFVVNAHGFMTDVTFTAAALGALLFFLRHAQRRRLADLLAALLFSAAATLIRQVGVGLPAAYLLLCLPSARREKVRFAQAAATVGVILGVLALFESWLRASGELTPVHLESYQMLGRTMHGHLLKLAGRVGWYCARIAVYAGLFLLPVVVVRRERAPTGGTRRGWQSLAAASLVLALGGYLWSSASMMPLIKNTFTSSGLGVRTLKCLPPRLVVLPERVIPLPRTFWIALTVSGVVSVSLLICSGLTAALARRRGRGPTHHTWLLLWCSLLLLAPFLVTQHFFDRYLIPAGACWIAAACAGRRLKRIGLPSLAALLVFGGFAAAGTHDYLAWNRVRWAVLHDLVEVRRIPAENIDGGFEYTGLLFPARLHGNKPVSEYQVCDERLQTFEVIEERPVRTFLPWGPRAIFVLRKQAAATGPAGPPLTLPEGGRHNAGE